MIHSKLEIRYLIHSLNELEKLKRLLFDDDQFYLFEHIPKPYLIDSEEAKIFDSKIDSKKHQSLSEASVLTPTNQNILKSKTIQQKADKRQNNRNKAQTLLSNNSFWTKQSTDGSKIQELSKALDNIKKKKVLNVIDRRLLSVINEFSSQKGEFYIHSGSDPLMSDGQLGFSPNAKNQQNFDK